MSDSARRSTAWLDVARAVAIVGVVATHSDQFTAAVLKRWGVPVQPDLFRFTQFGRYGVELFFFISGWLIGLLYTERLEVASYSLRRAARIWPLWAAFTILGIGEALFLHAGPWHDAVNSGLHKPLILVLALTFTAWLSNPIWNTVIPGGWSIQVEVGHYIAFPFLRRLGIQRLLWTLVALSAFNALLPALARREQGTLLAGAAGAVLRFGVLTTLLFFLLGVLAQALVSGLSQGRSPDWRQEPVRQSQLGWAAVVLLCMVPALVLPFGDTLAGLGFISVGIPIAILLDRTPVAHGPAAWLGRRSYFVYFCHFHVLILTSLALGHLLPSPPGVHFLPAWSLHVGLFTMMFALALGLSAVLSEPSYRYFERPIIQAAHRATDGSRARVLSLDRS